MRRVRGWLCFSTAILIAIGGNSARAADEPTTSVVTLMKEKRSWKIFAETKTTLAIEGRLDESRPDRVTFSKCDLPCPAETGVTLPILPRKTQNARITGHFDLSDNKPVFRVRTVSASPTDDELIAARRQKLDRSNREEWMSFGDWVAERAAFYEDDALLPAAHEAWVRGYELLRSEESEVTSEKLVGWVAEMSSKGIPAELTLHWVHEALLKERLALGAQAPLASLDGFLTRVGKLLPGGLRPLELPQPKLAETYRENPRVVYDRSDAETRRKLERILYADLAIERVSRDASDDGANGETCAARIEKLLPEFPELAAAYRRRHLDYRRTHLDTVTREQVVEIARQLRLLKLDVQADETLDAWLRLKLRSWRRDGVDGLLYAAAEYLNLREDRENAVALLKEAWNLEPGHRDVTERLERLGLRLSGKEWITAEEFANLPEDPLLAAARRGEILAGMSPELVLKALGNPDRRHRAVTSRVVSDVWVYGSEGTARLTIHFQRPVERSPSQSVVIAVGNRPAAPR